MKKNPRIVFALTALAWLLAAAPIFGQSSAVSGQVTDSSGLPVSGATIDIVSPQTTETHSTRTNDSGHYLFPPLNPGTYVVHIVAPGFATATVEGMTVEVGGSRAIDVTLAPANQTQSVTVMASAPELVVDRPDRGNVIESQFVENTPLNIRNPLQLINFSQGVTTITLLGSSSGNNNVSEVFSNAFRINGGKLATTENLLDGAANTSRYDFNGVAAVPQVEAIREFKVLTTAYAPEWGRTSGAIVTYATRSGTNEYHGSLFEYLRNSALDAAGFNANSARIPNPHFQRNQFGYAFGGPVYIPRVYHGKNKTFFYTTWEQLRQSQGASFLGTVPTALEREGDFSQTRDTNGNLIVIYDPTTTRPDPAAPAGTTRYIRTPFQNNVIPPSLQNAVSLNLLGYYPLPNQSGQGLSNTNNFFSNAPVVGSQNTVDSRVDHRFNDNHSIFIRFDWFQRFNNPADPYGNGYSAGLNRQRLPGYNGVVDHTWVLNPSTVFEHHFVYAHQESNRIPAGVGFNTNSLGFNPNVTAGLRVLGFPSVANVTRVTGLGPTSGLEADAGTVMGYAASFSKLTGKHSFKTGVDFRYFPTQFDIAPLVTVTANNNFTGGPNPQAASGLSGSGVADLLLGAATVSSGFAPAYHYHHPYYALYAQDTYAVTPRLTFTYGLRYSIEPPFVEEKNQYIYIDLSNPSPLNTQVKSLGTLTGGPGFTGVNGAGREIQTTQTRNFDPRVGFAYHLDDQTVIRGGFGIFHAPSVDAGTASAGFGVTTTSRAALPDGVTPQFNLANPFPQGLIQPTGNSLGLNTLIGQNISGLPREQKISYSEQWSLDVQRQLPGRFVVTVGYVGNHALNLYTPENYNQLPDAALAQGSKLLAQVPNPFFGVITDQTSPLSAPTVQYGQLLRPHPQFLNMIAYAADGQANYHALQMSVEHRFSGGLALLFSYTHSKMTDDVGDYASGTFQGAQPQNNNCISCDHSISGQDLPDVLRLSGQYELPLGRGKRFVSNGLPAAIFGGFTLGSFFTYDNGLPLALTSPNFSNSFGGGNGMRPNATGISPTLDGGPQMINNGLYFNPAAFSQTPSFQFGNAARYLTALRAPGTFNWDIMMSRQISISERLALEMRGELFNAFNNVQFAGPNTDISSASFGRIFLNQVNTPRQVQFGLRLRF
jgi:hypothetical protein